MAAATAEVAGARDTTHLEPPGMFFSLLVTFIYNVLANENGRPNTVVVITSIKSIV